MTPWAPTADGLLVRCRLTPKGGRDALDGVAALSDGTAVLLARVREPPEDGRANEALCRLIAKAVGIPASRARIAAGAKSRVKQVALEGHAETLAAALSLAAPSS